MLAVNGSAANPSENEEPLAAARVGDLAGARARWSRVANISGWWSRRIAGRRASATRPPRTWSRTRCSTPGGASAGSRGVPRGSSAPWLRAILIHSLIKARRRPAPLRLECGPGGAPIPAINTPPSRIVQRDESNEVIDAAMRLARALSSRHPLAIVGGPVVRGDRRGLESRTIAPRNSMGARSPGCGSCWEPAMNPDDPSAGRSVEDAQARVVLCDARLRVASTSALPAAASLPVGGHDRLRLLLRLLEASEGDDDRESVAGRVSSGDGRDDNRLLLGRFEVLEHLGSGGFGFVVRARDRLLGREVALKMPLPERMLGSGDVSRFLREARSAARLDHPNIVRVFDAGQVGPIGYFIASEYCAGQNLRQWLNQRDPPIAPRLAVRWTAALADAVQHAHERGIFHRDVKPENIMMAGGPDRGALIPRLGDFGLAKLVEDAGGQTRSEARLGTPQYMAPEQASGRHDKVGPATDVYALGADPLRNPDRPSSPIR